LDKSGSTAFEVNAIENNVIAGLCRGAPMMSNNDQGSGTSDRRGGGNGKMICRDPTGGEARIDTRFDAGKIRLHRI
jgi:hypothetical protein